MSLSLSLSLYLSLTHTMDRRRSPASFDSTAPTFSHFSTSLAQKLRAAKKIPAPEEEDKAVERAKAARFEDYLRKTAPGNRCNWTIDYKRVGPSVRPAFSRIIKKKHLEYLFGG